MSEQYKSVTFAKGYYMQRDINGEPTVFVRAGAGMKHARLFAEMSDGTRIEIKNFAVFPNKKEKADDPDVRFVFTPSKQ